MVDWIKESHDVTATVSLTPQETRAALVPLLVAKANYIRSHTPMYSHLPEFTEADIPSGGLLGVGQVAEATFHKKLPIRRE